MLFGLFPRGRRHIRCRRQVHRHLYEDDPDAAAPGRGSDRTQIGRIVLFRDPGLVRIAGNGVSDGLRGQAGCAKGFVQEPVYLAVAKDIGGADQHGGPGHEFLIRAAVAAEETAGVDIVDNKGDRDDVGGQRQDITLEISYALK
jgi:hypothetical protein